MKINVIYISLTQHMANKISGQMCSVVICRHTVLSKIIKSKQMFHSLSICRLKRFGLPLQYARRLNKDYSIILTRYWEWFTYFDIIFIDRFKGILIFLKKRLVYLSELHILCEGVARVCCSLMKCIFVVNFL